MRPTLALIALALVAVGTVGMAQTATPPNHLQASPTWNDLRGDVVGDVDIKEANGLFDVIAPYRAEDAGTVPITIRQPEGADPIRSATLVIDENPSPVVAQMTFGALMMPLDLEMRVRVNQYSDVRVIADTASGHYMEGRYVKASGGCSAPASRSPEMALARLGEMRLRSFDKGDAQSGHRREAQIMIRHPNYSGLQRDQITQLFIPAHFIDRLEVRQGDDLLFTLQGGISISENPVFRFSYTDNGAPTLSVQAHDTEGNVWKNELPKDSGT